ncbi:MAG: TetR/AcrR family transcriptional regulator [Verrucomicrobiae bacterium]|nr:TetR/AcrR family transcriptional regulator [Verrucomicrobiae bacterium]
MGEKTTWDQIVEAADRLFYEKGYEHTSFSDLSAVVGISRGNVSFHFKTKDEILEAVIDLRLDRTRRMLEQWEADGAGCEDRIRSFINILIMNRAKILLYGCPVGTLCAELAKLDHSALAHANQLFGLFRDWLGRQFSQLGREADAEALAMHLLAWSQGIATLANAFHDESFIRQEVRQLHDWVQALPRDVRPAQNTRSAGRAPKTMPAGPRAR